MYLELKREVEIIGEYEALVVGGGASGICAAISCGRQGVRTALIERYGSLGGGLTNGYIGPVMGGTSSGTIADEIHKRLKIIPRQVHDFERAKIEIPNMIKEAGADFYLQSPAADVIMDGNVISGVVIATPMGMKAIKGKIIVDATGDGTVSYMAGAPYEIGRESDGLVQPVSLMFVLGGVEEDAIYCEGVHPDVKVPAGDFVELCKKACSAGELPENVDTVRIYHTGNKTERMINATQVNFVNPLSVKSISDCEANVRKQIEKVHNFLKAYAPGYEKSYIKGSSTTIGVRESRRITGEYVLKDEDVETGRKFEDVVVHSANFLLDIHNPSGGGQAEGEAKRVRAYDIPLRCFIPKKVENLFVTGRAISGTHRAHSSYRVMNICMPMGEAVGVASALCVKEGVTPRKLDFHKVQEVLIKLGVDLFSDKEYSYPFNPSN